MSVRSELRAEALKHAGYRCEWPLCRSTRRLELSHIRGLGAGGSRSRDVLGNVAMLCAHCHSVLDSRVSWNQSQEAVLILFDAYVDEYGAHVQGHCLWPGCLNPGSKYVTAVPLCAQHQETLVEPIAPGRGYAVKRLLAAYLDREACFLDERRDV